ncbi:pyridine nucleotide-disulfide oxidoreductase [Tieghemostelium lacteum]|uniref:NADH:ubiquinone reductase (non-electrogenic) n=1 Tax=Tieghemostelium lacteum TaxID=361077 RepID=A0A151Z5K0_TIELA|nr:pyridine nucleotide-disulfide oxidoreductase [Tieghemostelium lacteum]|eukprot:KYQ89249.1 pyridine nucleotide-disulfide oxidoreductase [Tieghemostelium lacteum]
MLNSRTIINKIKNINLQNHKNVLKYSNNENLGKLFYSTSPSTSTGDQNNSSNNNNNNTGKQKKKMNRFVFWGGLGLAAWSTAYFADLIINDDLDSIPDRFRTRLPESKRDDRPRVVILGTGWASLTFLRKLHTDEFNVTIVSPRNYFLFTPLLVGGTTGTLEVRSIIEPVRKYCQRADANEATFIEAECVSVDPKKKTIKCVDNSAIKGEVSEFELEYDHLIVGVGADNQTFGIPGVRENSCFLKEINDTRVIRDRILDCLETASYPGQPEKEIDRLLNFVVVGGGPSGVEFTAELKDFLHSDLLRTYPLAKRINVTLVEALPHILNVFDKKIVDHVEKRLQETSNFKILTKTAVTNVREKEITVRNDQKVESQIPYGLLVWATGNTPRKITTQIGQSIGTNIQNNRRGLIVDEYFRVVGAEGIWAIGDACIDPQKPLAQTAQVANQQARYLGRLFNHLAEDIYRQKVDDKPEVVPITPQQQQTLVIHPKHAELQQTFDNILKKQPLFKYHHMGTLAYVGDHQAVAEFKGDTSTTTFEGYVTYYLWRSVYFSKLLSLKNRVLVAFDWTKSTIFGRDVSRG